MAQRKPLTTAERKQMERAADLFEATTRRLADHAAKLALRARVAAHDSRGTRTRAVRALDDMVYTNWHTKLERALGTMDALAERIDRK